MIRPVLLAAGLLFAAAPALAVTPQPGSGDPRIREVVYDPSEVVELAAVLGYQMTVEFDPLERIENVALGDALGWQVTPNRKANLLFLKPMSRRPATNMTVVTSLRRYNFHLTVRGGPASDRSVTYAVRFLYAAPMVVVAEPPAPPAPPIDRNHAYTYEGSSKTVPQRLFDDGESTFFTFRGDSDFPAVFAIDPDGAEAAVNTYMRGGYLVVDRVAPGFVLRRGSEVTHVFNDAFKIEPPGALSPRLRPKDPWWRR